MSQHQKEHRTKRSDHSLRHLPADVLLKARSTLVSLSGALKPKHQEQQKVKPSKQEFKERSKMKNERLKNSKSEPEFGEMERSKHRSRIDDKRRDNGARPRPQSVGTSKRYSYERDHDAYDYRNLRLDSPKPYPRRYDSSEEVCVQSRLVLPVASDRFGGQDLHLLENEKPRKKLSFREPEIVDGRSATLGRTQKHMGVNSLTMRPQRFSFPVSQNLQCSSLENLYSDLESQAMRIVRTVGQAFEVCHKLANNAEPVASTSSAIDEIRTEHLSDAPPSKEAVSDCGASASAAACSREPPDDPVKTELLPPPPSKNGQRSPQLTVTTPTINLPDLPECVTKVDLICDQPSGDTSLSAQHQLQLLKERLEQQAQQTRAAVAQLLLLRDQLAVEQAARCEAQARTHQLLVHNKELLEHIAALVAHLQDRERGNSRSTINAQQLTMLPQATVNLGPQNMRNMDNYTTNSNMNIDADAFLGLISQGHKITQNLENNNLRSSPFDVTPSESTTPKYDPSISHDFTGLSNEQIQNYLINKFQNMGGYPQENAELKTQNVNNQQFYQNNTAFPNIPPLTNHYSNLDLSSLLNHNIYGSPRNTGPIGQPEDSLGVKTAMNLVRSQSSLFSASPAGTSKDSTPDALSSDDGGVSFIMPLSHKATLTSASEDGRIRLIVPVSPSPSTAEVANESSSLRGPSSSITRSTSEKVPNHSEMMSAMRAQWTRHTTK